MYCPRPTASSGGAAPSPPSGSSDGPEPRPRLSLFVGPEGGFAPRQIELAAEQGALTVSLGPRILRTETAGPVLAALALYEAGELAPVVGDGFAPRDGRDAV